MKASRRAAIPLLTVMILLLAASPCGAQGGVTIQLHGVNIDRFPEVTAYLTVSDANGLPVVDLTPDRFELIEDGQASFPPDAVLAVTNDQAATSVLILLDLGTTMGGEPLEAARVAIARFLDRLLDQAGDPDRAAFIGFGQQVDIKSIAFGDEAREVPFTDDKGRLLNVVNFVAADVEEGTPLYDALYRAVKIMAGQPGRRAVIVMTDGRDVASALKDDDPISEAQRQRIPVFPIGLSNARLDRNYLMRLAELTGGQYQEAPAPDEFAERFDEVLVQLKTQYELKYQSRLPAIDGRAHSLLARVSIPAGQGFDEIKFQLGTPPAEATAVPPSPIPTLRATAIPTPQPTATPAEEKDIMDEITTWISDNTLMAAAIGAAVVLLIALVILIAVLARRRAARAAAQEQPQQWAEEWPAPAGADQGALPSWVAPAQPAPGAGRGGTMGGFGSQTEGQLPTGRTGPGTEAGTFAAPPAAGTWVSPADAPAAGRPFGMPGAGRGAPPTGEGEETVLLDRGPKMKAIGFLVDRRRPDRRFDVNKPTVMVGRASSNNIAIDDPTVSRQHATIRLEGGVFRIFDLGSANGTFVAGQRVREPVVLEDGALVRFGDAEFVFKQMSLE